MHKDICCGLKSAELFLMLGTDPAHQWRAALPCICTPALDFQRGSFRKAYVFDPPSEILGSTQSCAAWKCFQTVCYLPIET